MNFWPFTREERRKEGSLKEGGEWRKGEGWERASPARGEEESSRQHLGLCARRRDVTSSPRRYCWCQPPAPRFLFLTLFSYSRGAVHACKTGHPTANRQIRKGTPLTELELESSPGTLGNWHLGPSNGNQHRDHIGFFPRERKKRKSARASRFRVSHLKPSPPHCKGPNLARCRVGRK